MYQKQTDNIVAKEWNYVKAMKSPENTLCSYVVFWMWNLTNLPLSINIVCVGEWVSERNTIQGNGEDLTQLCGEEETIAKKAVHEWYPFKAFAHTDKVPSCIKDI